MSARHDGGNVNLVRRGKCEFSKYNANQQHASYHSAHCHRHRRITSLVADMDMSMSWRGAYACKVSIEKCVVFAMGHHERLAMQ